MRWRAEVNKHLRRQQRSGGCAGGSRSHSPHGHELRRPRAGARRAVPRARGHRAPRCRRVGLRPRRRPARAWRFTRTPKCSASRPKTRALGRRESSGHVTRAHRDATRACARWPARRRACSAWWGCSSPIYVHPLQAMVSEPIKPWLDPIVVSGSLHVYVSQSARGELVMGASLDPYELHSSRSTLDFVEHLAAHMLDLFPFLADVKVNRQWAGMADMTPDFAPDAWARRPSAVSISTRAGARGASRRRRCAARPWPHGGAG